MTHSGIFKEFHAVIMPVRDAAMAADWYKEKFDLEARRQMPGMVVMGAGDKAHICLFESSDSDRSKVATFANFRAENLNKTRSTLKERGVSCSEIQSMPQLRFMTVLDLDGNRIDVCEYGPDWLA